MVTMQTIVEQLTGKDIADALVKVMAENFEDFAAAQKQYNEALHTLHEELPADLTPSVTEVMEAIQKQTVSNLLFSGFLGIKANLDNFINPIARNFLDVDFEIYLRENTARRLPAYVSAQKTLDRFVSPLTPAQKTAYDDVISYISHLETTGPKLAHFYGYLLGNELLYQVIPGYHADTALTIQYRLMLQRYFGKPIPLL